MNKNERILNISASVCSLIAFIILIIEKTPVFKLSIANIFGGAMYGVWIIGLFFIYTYGLMSIYKNFFNENLFFKGLGVLGILIITFILVLLVVFGEAIYFICKSLIEQVPIMF